MSLAPNDPEVVIFERSPFGNMDAIVQQDGRTLYFYLSNGQPDGTQACWLGNLVKGPLTINTEEMKQGLPPLLPRIHCAHPNGRELPSESDLELVWFEEGNGAAVLESGDVLGIIPPWSGVEGFEGYARDCISETEVAWPIPETNSMHRRIENARSFWQSFESGNPFAELQTPLLEAQTKRFGAEINYWSIDGNQFPPRGLAQWDQDGNTTLSTVGMSLCPQPKLEMYVENPSLHRRIEIAFQLPTELATEPVIDQLGQAISGLARMPWQHQTWFGHQHTCEFKSDAFPDTPFALLWMDPRVPLGVFRDDPVQTLWLIPISDTELESLRNKDYRILESDPFRSRLPFD